MSDYAQNYSRFKNELDFAHYLLLRLSITGGEIYKGKMVWTSKSKVLASVSYVMKVFWPHSIGRIW